MESYGIESGPEKNFDRKQVNKSVYKKNQNKTNKLNYVCVI